MVDLHPETPYKYGRYERPKYWKQINGYDGMYEVSNFGDIGSWQGHGIADKSDHLRILSPTKKSNGTLKVCLTDPFGEKKTVLVHRIVADHFLNNPNNYDIVLHKDGDKSNNKADNLRWVSRTEWYDKSIKTNKKIPIGNKKEKHPKALLTNEQVHEIIDKYSDCVGRPKKYGERKTQQEIAKEYGVSRATIHNILTKKNWQK